MIIDSRIKYIKILAGIGLALAAIAGIFHIPTFNSIYGLITGIPFLGAISLGGFVLSDYYKKLKKTLSTILRLGAILIILGYFYAIIMSCAMGVTFK